MKQQLQYGNRYRVTVDVAPSIRLLITAELVRSELAGYQLRNAVVRQTDLGYTIEADYLGRTGTYDLPADVRSFELVGPVVRS